MHLRSSFLVLACAAIACGDSGPTNAAAPLLAADPDLLDFGIVDVDGSSGALVVTVENTGTAPLAAPLVSITGPAAADFAVDSTDSTCPSQALAVDASCSLEVFFAPSASGARTAALSMRGSGGGETLIELSGTGAGLLSVARDGTGSGTVMSSPAGIVCGAECAANFAETVTLMATPDADSYFVGWSGACTGSGECVVPPGDAPSATATFARYPETVFTTTPLSRTNRPVASWSFSGERAASFECSLDGAAFSACTSPLAITEFGAGGSSALRVRAIDASGQADPTPAEGTVTLVTDPILRYPFNGSAANAGELAGYDGAAGSVTYLAGKVGTAMKFDGTDATGVVLTNTRLVLGADHRWTIALWFREDVPKADSRLIVLRGLPDGSGWETYHGVSTANMTTCSEGGCFGFATPTAGVWHHLLFRYDGASATAGAPLDFYVDGAYAGSIENPESVPLTGEGLRDISLGRDPLYGDPSVFYVDELEIFNTVFTPAEQCTRIIAGTWTGSTCTLP